MNIEPYRSAFPAVTFAFPEDLHMSAWTEHVPFAFWLVALLKPRTLVELGTFRGTSFLAFCQAIAATGAETHAYAVDSWKGDEHAGILPPDAYREVKRAVDLKYSAFATLLRMDFDAATAHVPDGTVDLLHIGGFHTYEAVRHDFERWRDKLSPDAVVLFHDIQVFERDFGVNRFWNEVRGLGRSFEFHHGHELGVLALGGGGSVCPCSWRRASPTRPMCAPCSPASGAGSPIISAERSWIQRRKRCVPKPPSWHGSPVPGNSVSPVRFAG